MKEFSLEEYLKNPNREVVTRDERKVRIICTDRKNHDSYPIIALVESDEDDERVRSYKIDGKWSVDGLENSLDLFFAPTKHEGWMNVYKDRDLGNMGDRIYESEQDARKAGSKDPERIDTIKIEWKE